MAGFGFHQPFFGADGGPDLVAFEAEHARKSLRNPFIIIDNEDLGGLLVRQDGGH